MFPTALKMEEKFLVEGGSFSKTYGCIKRKINLWPISFCYPVHLLTTLGTHMAFNMASPQIALIKQAVPSNQPRPGLSIAACVIWKVPQQNFKKSRSSIPSRTLTRDASSALLFIAQTIVRAFLSVTCSHMEATLSFSGENSAALSQGLVSIPAPIRRLSPWATAEKTE